jgi:hypothetical protein
MQYASMMGYDAQQKKASAAAQADEEAAILAEIEEES